MTTTPNTWNGITISVSPANSPSQVHRHIDITLALDPQTKHQYAREDLFASFRWYAGFLARIALDLDYSIKRRSREQGHHCASDPLGYTCGYWWEEGASNPRWAVDEECAVPMVSMMVPTELAEAWAELFHRRVTQTLVDDLTPLIPTRGTNHGPVILAEPALEPHKATT